jgi:ArsR family transcriptional regulator
MSKYRNNEIERFAEIFGALSNPNRLQIFLRLLSCCTPGTVCETEAELHTCVGEVGEGLGIAPSTVSHHLKELRQAGLIRMERHGQKAECSIDPETLQILADFFAQPSVQ